MGRHLSPQYGQVILVSGYPVRCVQYQFSCAPKLAKNARLNIHCGADGRAGSRRAVYGHVITKFSGMGLC